MAVYRAQTPRFGRDLVGKSGLNHGTYVPKMRQLRIAIAFCEKLYIIENMFVFLREDALVIARTDFQPVELPEDLLWALDANTKAQAIFDRFPKSQREAYILWIESARRAETRARRIQQALAMILSAKQ